MGVEAATSTPKDVHSNPTHRSTVMERYDEITVRVGLSPSNLTVKNPDPVKLSAEPITVSVGLRPATLTVISPKGDAE